MYNLLGKLALFHLNTGKDIVLGIFAFVELESNSIHVRTLSETATSCNGKFTMIRLISETFLF